MIKKTAKAGLLAGILTVALILAGCDGNSDNVKDSYKIGVIAPLSGPNASAGQQLKTVLDYHLAELNAKNSFKISLEYEDGKCDQTEAANAFHKLTDVIGVRFILGGLCSEESLGIAPLLKDSKVIALSGWSGSPDIEGESPNLFSLSYSDTLIGQAMVTELGKFKKIALISEKSDYNDGVKKVVENELANNFKKTKIVADEQIDASSSDFKNTLAKIKTSQVQAVLLNTNNATLSENLLAQIGQSGLKTKLIGGVAYNNADFMAKVPKVSEGMIIIDNPDISNKDFLAYLDKIVAEKSIKLNDLGPYYSATAVDALDIMATLISENKGDITSVQKGLSTGTFEGKIGKIVFGGKNFVQGIQATKYVVKDGKPVKL